MSDAKVSDLLGVKPWGEAANKLVSSVLDGCAALLGRICLPAAEEFGLGLRDRVAGWRAKNLAAAAAAAERKLGASGAEGLKAHPRLVRGFIEEASWVDDPDLQEMWGGLLASSCTEDGLDDSNVLFQDLLSGMTSLQARVLRYACERTRKFIAEANGFAMADEFPVDRSVALSALGVGDDPDRLDRELDRLRASGLLSETSGFPMESHGLVIVGLTPTTLGMHLYVRCQGSRESPVGYFKVTEIRRPVAGHRLARNVLWQPLDPEGGAGGPSGS